MTAPRERKNKKKNPSEVLQEGDGRRGFHSARLQLNPPASGKPLLVFDLRRLCEVVWENPPPSFLAFKQNARIVAGGGVNSSWPCWFTYYQDRFYRLNDHQITVLEWLPLCTEADVLAAKRQALTTMKDNG